MNLVLMRKVFRVEHRARNSTERMRCIQFDRMGDVLREHVDPCASYGMLQGRIRVDIMEVRLHVDGYMSETVPLDPSHRRGGPKERLGSVPGNERPSEPSLSPRRKLFSSNKGALTSGIHVDVDVSSCHWSLGRLECLHVRPQRADS